MHVCGSHAQQDPYTFQCAMTMHVCQTAQLRLIISQEKMSLSSILGVILFIVFPMCQCKCLYIYYYNSSRIVTVCEKYP